MDKNIMAVLIAPPAGRRGDLHELHNFKRNNQKLQATNN